MSKFDLKNKVDSAIYQAYNLASDLLFYASIKKRKIARENEKLRGVSSAKRCFIIGTGPSLNDLPKCFLEHISKEVSFGVNFLYKSDLFDQIKPEYYVLMDDLFWSELSHVFADVKEKYQDVGPIFITDYRARNLVEQEGLFLHAKNYPVNKIRLDLAGNSSELMNVTSYAIAAAIYLGFKEIYLVGCDYNAFCTNGVGHCYDDDELKESGLNLAYFLKFYHITTEIHYLLSAEAKRAGIKVINLTEGSLLDAYPRLSYKQVRW